MNNDAFLTLVEDFELLVPVDRYIQLTRDVAARIEEQGLQGVVSMLFYASEDARHAGAVLRFADGSVFAEHVRMISSWPELKEFMAMTRTTEIRAYGTLPPELESWLTRFQGRVVKLPRFVAGFERSR